MEKFDHKITIIDPSFPSEYDFNADVTLVFKCLDDWANVNKCSGAKVVYQPDDLRYPHIKELMQQAREHCDYALTYDDEAVKVCLQQFNFKVAERLLLTADQDLYRPLGLKKTIDFCFVGNLSHPSNHFNRRKMLEILAKKGYTVGYMDAVYDIQKIVELYNSSKIVLNHATDVGQPFGFGYGYQCRHFEVGMTKSCLLTNHVYDNDKSLIGYEEFSSEEDLLNKAKMLLEDEEKRENLSRILYNDVFTHHLPMHRGEQLTVFFKRICNELV